jgi:hypothetical protein
LEFAVNPQNGAPDKPTGTIKQKSLFFIPVYPGQGRLIPDYTALRPGFDPLFRSLDLDWPRGVRGRAFILMTMQRRLQQRRNHLAKSILHSPSPGP